MHETYANFTHVQKLISGVLRTFPYNEKNLTSLLRNGRCTLYQVNEKLQCKKIKKRKKWIDFRKSGACKINDIERNKTTPKELQALDQAKSAAVILVETLEFWENCVFEKKRGRLVIAKKCKKVNRNIRKRNRLRKSRRRKNRKHKNSRKNKKQKNTFEKRKNRIFLTK